MWLVGGDEVSNRGRELFEECRCPGGEVGRSHVGVAVEAGEDLRGYGRRRSVLLHVEGGEILGLKERHRRPAESRFGWNDAGQEKKLSLI